MINRYPGATCTNLYTAQALERIDATTFPARTSQNATGAQAFVSNERCTDKNETTVSRDQSVVGHCGFHVARGDRHLDSAVEVMCELITELSVLAELGWQRRRAVRVTDMLGRNVEQRRQKVLQPLALSLCTPKPFDAAA